MASPWKLAYARYANGVHKFIGYLWSETPMPYQLDVAANMMRGSLIAPRLHFVEYPGNDVLQGYGPPRCLKNDTAPWGWVQIIEVGGFTAHAWWYTNCYDAEELVRWLKGSDMPGRIYDFSGRAVA